MAIIEPVAVAVLAKAPVPGLAKTRLIPMLGAEGAALLQARLIERAIETACAAAVGSITLWGAPDASHPLFRGMEARGIQLARQTEGDLGARMLQAASAAQGPVLVIGTDCPALASEHLRTAADLLRNGIDVVVCPAEDGGYVLIGMRSAQPALFDAMPWSTGEVMRETRRRLRSRGLVWREPAVLWDVDRSEDLQRLVEIGFADICDQVISDQ